MNQESKTRRQGEIAKLGENRWRVRWFLGRENGRRRYTSEVVRGTKKEAQAKLNEKLHSLAHGMYVAPSKETLGVFLDHWEKDVATRVSEKTFAGYQATLARHVRPALGAVGLQKLDARAVQEFVNQIPERAGRTLSARTQREVYRVLRQALGKAVRWGLIARNPTDHVDLPKGQPREKRPLSAEEVKRFREAVRGKHFELVFDVLLASGMRPGEALGLRWQDVDLETGMVRVAQAVTEVPKLGLRIVQPKTVKSARLLPLSKSVIARLRQHRAKQAERTMRLGASYDREGDLIFATLTGGPVSHRNLRRAYLEACRKASIGDVRGPYDLRHTAATLLIEAGVPIKTVSERLGHANVAITLGVYVHTTPAQHDQAAAVLGTLVE